MTILRYVLLFFFYSAIGWALESLYRSIGEKKIINSGFLTGPMCPIYGTGALFMTVCLYNPFYDKPLLVFLFGMLICDTVEYVTSFLMELLFNQHWWDYTYEFCNIRGRICLKHTLYWGIGSIGFVYMIHPTVDKYMNLISDKVVIILLVAIFVVFLADLIHTVIKSIDVRALQTKFLKFRSKISEPINVARNKVDDIGSSISDKLNESNDKLTVSRQELYDQVSELIESFEVKLNVSSDSDKKNTDKKEKKNRLYNNVYMRRNFDKELTWLKKIRDEIKANLSESEEKQ